MVAVLSLVLIIPAVGSYFLRSRVGCVFEEPAGANGGSRSWGLSAATGSIGFGYSRYRTSAWGFQDGTVRLGPVFWFMKSEPMNWEATRNSLLGFGGYSQHGRPPMEYHLLAAWAPAWIPMVICTIAPVLWLRRRVRQRRLGRPGLCRECSYDLRATPEEGGELLERCPECGAETKRKTELAG